MNNSQPFYTLTQPVFFIGFMGAGKTSVVRALAHMCGLAYVDLDTYLESREDRIIADIFRDQGENHFRDLETQYLKELACQPPRLISCGGGVVKCLENQALMKESGFVVYLAVTAEEAAHRIPDTESRPLFKNVDTARATLQERLPLYEAAASVCVDTVGSSIREVAQKVQKKLEDAGVLVQA